MDVSKMPAQNRRYITWKFVPGAVATLTLLIAQARLCSVWHAKGVKLTKAISADNVCAVSCSRTEWYHISNLCGIDCSYMQRHTSKKYQYADVVTGRPCFCSTWKLLCSIPPTSIQTSCGLLCAAAVHGLHVDHGKKLSALAIGCTGESYGWIQRSHMYAQLNQGNLDLETIVSGSTTCSTAHSDVQG
jgi:hypothetical protein